MTLVDVVLTVIVIGAMIRGTSTELLQFILFAAWSGVMVRERDSTFMAVIPPGVRVC